MDDLSNKVDDIACKFDNLKNDVNTQISDFKSEVNTKVLELEKTVVFVANKFDTQEQKIQELQDELGRAINSQLESSDALEQYSRRNCLVLHGIPESANEDTDALIRETISQHLGVEVKARDLDRTHRIGAKRSNASGRPIIAKFARYDVRARVFREKKHLKGTRIVLTESLTKRRVALLNEARDKYGKNNVWTSDGEIFTLTRDKKPVNVRQLSFIYMWSPVKSLLS